MTTDVVDALVGIHLVYSQLSIKIWLANLKKQ